MRKTLAQDGPRCAANAINAAQALQSYLSEVSKSDGRPDYTKPPALILLRQVFNLEKFATLPPPKSSDMDWLPEWGDAASLTYWLILLFGQESGPDLDQTAVQRNVFEYEDQCASALEFILHFQARQATAMLLFMDQLGSQQHTPTREAGLLKARGNAAEIIAGALISIAQCMKASNARIVTTALLGTREVWVKFILPNVRTHIIDQTTRTVKIVKDDEVRKRLMIFAETLAVARQ